MNPYRVDTPGRISFSGGRTSGYMLYQIIQAFGGTLPDDLHVVFANTGEEAEETLEFVRDCQERWGVPIRWVEYRRTDGPVIKPGTENRKNPHIGCHGFIEVDFATASRKGEPFDAIIDVKADYRKAAKDETPILPNVTDRWCSGELKARTMERFSQSIGLREYSVYVGIRYDEPRRYAKLTQLSNSLIEYDSPLYRARAAEATVLDFWARMPFDLKLKHDAVLGTYRGNCNGCFLKRPAKIVQSTLDDPTWVDRWAERERRTGATFARGKISYVELAAKRVPLTCVTDSDDDTCMCTD